VNVLICSTDTGRTVVEIDGNRHADTKSMLMFPIPHMVAAYGRVKAQVTIASLPAGSKIN